MFWDALQPYVAWWGSTAFAMWLGQSTWRIAWLLTFHLFGLTMLLGTIGLSSLNWIGLFQRRKPVAELQRDLGPVMLAGLLLMVATGALIFTGGAQEYFAGFWFRLKMTLLTVALLFHFTVFRVITRAEKQRVSPFAMRVTGVVTLLLWFGVGWAGRAIAFF